MYHRRFVVVVLVVTVAAGAAFGAGGYDISTPTDVDTPERTVSAEGESFTVTAIAKAQPGETIQVSVTRPEATYGRLYVYRNDDGQTAIVTSERIDAAETTVSFDTSRWGGSGSYVLSIWENDTNQAVLPVVLEGYETSFEPPDAVEAGGSLDLRVTLSAGDRSLPPQRVEFVFANESTHSRVAADQVSDGTYEATLSLSEYDPGEYRAYAVVYSQESTGADENEIVALSDAKTVTLTETDDGSATEGGSSDGGEETPTVTPTQTTPTTTGPQGTTVPTHETSTSTDTTDEPPSSTTGGTDLPSSPTTTTDSSVITPNSPTTSTAVATPGFSLATGLAALALAGFVLARRD